MFSSSPLVARRSSVTAALVAVTATVVTSLVAVPKAAQAQVTSYTNLAAFNAAATTSQLFDFEGIAPTGGIRILPEVSPLTISFSTGTNPYYIASGTFNNGLDSLNGSADFLANIADPAVVVVTLGFGNSVTAFATEFGLRDDTNTPTANAFTFQLYNGNTPLGVPYVSSPLSTGFIGFTSSQAFDRVNVSTSLANGQNTYQVYDNLRLGAAVGAPEPASVVLLFAGGGPLLLGLARWRLRRITQK